MQKLHLALVALVTAPAIVYPDSAAEKLSKGKKELDASMYAEAIRSLSESIKLDPKNADAYLLRGQAHEWSFQLKMALADFSSAIELDGKNAQAWYLRGKAYITDSEWKKAIADLTKAIDLDPKHASAHCFRGWAHFEEATYARAIADLKSAVQLGPEDLMGYELLAKALATAPDEKVRNGEKAVQIAMEACKMADWEGFGIIESLAAAYAECGKYEDAIKTQQKALDLAAKKESLASLREPALQRLAKYKEGKPLRYRSLVQWTNPE